MGFNKIFNFLVSISLFLLFSRLYAANILGGRKPKTPSEKKIVEIDRIVKEAIKLGKKDKKLDVENYILQKINETYPTSGKLIKIDMTKLDREGDKTANLKYPYSKEQLRDIYKIEADKKYKMIAKYSNIEVKYRIGRGSIAVVKGVFLGYNRYKNGIIIGYNVVPIFDLLPDYKAKFLDSYRGIKKREYIEKKIKNYLLKKRAYKALVIRNMIKKIGEENFKNGYIYAWQEWRTPEEVAQLVYQYEMAQMQ